MAHTSGKSLDSALIQQVTDMITKGIDTRLSVFSPPSYWVSFILKLVLLHDFLMLNSGFLTLDANTIWAA